MPAALWQPVTDRVDAAACSRLVYFFRGGEIAGARLQQQWLSQADALI